MYIFTEKNKEKKMPTGGQENNGKYCDYLYEVIKELKFTQIYIRFFIFDAIPFSFCSEHAYRAPGGTVKNAQRAPSKLYFFLVKFRSQ